MPSSDEGSFPSLTDLASAKTTVKVVQQKKFQADQIIFSSNINKNIHRHRLIPMYSMQISWKKIIRLSFLRMG